MEVQLIKGDITQAQIDVIVNAANTSLLGGGGVDGAIHKAGGKEILEECRKIRNSQGGCKVGEAVYTTAGKLNAQYIIHTVGPKWNQGNSNESEKLKSCYINSLEIAEALNLESIAFPNISTGIYGYPKNEAAKIAIKAIKEHKGKTLNLVQFVCFDEDNYKIYQKKLRNSNQSNLDIGEIEDRLNKSMKGHWTAMIEGEDHESGATFIMTGIKPGEDIWSENRGKDIYIDGGTIDDVKFIANAKEDIRKLIEEIRRIKGL